MAEITYTGRGSRGAPSASPGPLQRQQQQQAAQRPSTASPRIQGHLSGAQDGRSPDKGQPSAQRMLAFLDSAERAAGEPQPMFPASGSIPNAALGHGVRQAAGSGRQRQRPQSASQLRASGGPRLQGGAQDAAQPPPARQFGRASLFDHDTAERAPHEVPGPKVLRDLDKPRMGFPSRPPEEFLRAGEGLTLRQRNKLREHLRSNPVNAEAPFIPGTGGVRMSLQSAPPLSWSSRQPLPQSLLRVYYDNGTLDFVAVRWRGNREDALVWARSVSKGPEDGPHNRSYTAWAPEPPSEVDARTWLPIFLDGVREYEEPYRFLAIRGAEELLLKTGDNLHTFADALVSPLKSVLDTREPTTVAVALQLMMTTLAVDPRVAVEWAPHYWQFAQVLNLFRSRGGALVVDMGYNKREVASCRQLATSFMTDFELAGGHIATAAVRRYSPGHDPAVTDVSMARAAAKAAVKATEAGLDPGTFKPFTLF